MMEVISCPECQKSLRLPETLLGRTVQCPTCAHTFTARRPTDGSPSVPAPQETPSVARRRSPSREQEAPPPKRRRSRRNEEDEDDDSEDYPRRRRRKSGQGGLSLALGIVSIMLFLTEVPVAFSTLAFCPFCWGILALGGLGCSIPAWTLAHRDRERIRTGELNPSEAGLVSGGWYCGIIGTVLHTLVLLCGLGMFVIAATMMAASPRMRH